MDQAFPTMVLFCSYQTAASSIMFLTAGLGSSWITTRYVQVFCSSWVGFSLAVGRGRSYSKSAGFVIPHQCTPSSSLHVASRQTGALFETVCKGCDTQCSGCTVEGEEPICLEELGHSTSAGGNTSLESLLIERGYWRATNTSMDILACYNAEACLGGLTGGKDYCSEGYEGPCEFGETLYVPLHVYTKAV